MTTVLPFPLNAGVEPLVVMACRALPDAVVLTVRGAVDLRTSPLLRDRLLSHLRPAIPYVVVDLTRVTFFGVAGLTVLLDVREATEAAGIRLRLVAHTRVVLLPLAITGVDRVFDIHPNLDSALDRRDGPDG